MMEFSGCLCKVCGEHLIFLSVDCKLYFCYSNDDVLTQHGCSLQFGVSFTGDPLIQRTNVAKVDHFAC